MERVEKDKLKVGKVNLSQGGNDPQEEKHGYIYKKNLKRKLSYERLNWKLRNKK